MRRCGNFLRVEGGTDKKSTWAARRLSGEEQVVLEKKLLGNLV